MKMARTAIRPQKKLSWNAQRRGAIYCSPACGAGCTFATFQRATKLADELCLRLGPGWKPRVWENMGWHYSAISSCGRWKVHAHHYQYDYAVPAESYSAFLGDAESSGGYWAETADTPEVAMRRVWAKAKPVIDWHVECLTAEVHIPKK